MRLSVLATKGQQTALEVARTSWRSYRVRISSDLGPLSLGLRHGSFIWKVSLIAMKPLRHNYLHRWFAVILLVFATADLCADLVSPQRCSEWLNNLAIGDFRDLAPASQQPDAGATLTAADSQPEQPSLPSDFDDECFCCCAHTLPGMHFSVALSINEPPGLCLSNRTLPVPPSHSPFHPPRLS